jgi:pyruvate/2-oxoglutarate dehydrogenase complex dihydrolipoamide dehydrogenase (E3) component
MGDRFDVDLVVVGFGSAGMTAAELASRLGLSVTVIERSRAGGDCLWTGCVPSKALIAAAKVAHQMRSAGSFGLAAADAPIDTGAVWRRMREVREEIARGDDDPVRFEALGVRVRWGVARVVGPHEVAITADDGDVTTLTARIVLLCTGGRPIVPAIPGLAEHGYFTSESLFELEHVPGHVVFIGGGPISVELAQALCRLGIATTVLQRHVRLLPRDEPELVDMLTETLQADGVEVCCGVQVARIEPGPIVVGSVDGVERRWQTRAIVIAAGREVDISALGLEELGIEADRRGVVVDDRGRTSVRSIYAAGDVVGRQLFTHAAAHQAAVAIRDAFYPGRGRIDAIVPWATFTEPTLAHAGLTVSEARDRFGAHRVRVHRWTLDHNDRAHTDRTSGAIVLVERVRWGRSRLVGAHVLSTGAGELINELVVAMERGMSVADLGGVVHVYPTIATSLQQLGGQAAAARAHRYRWLRGRSSRWRLR